MSIKRSIKDIGRFFWKGFKEKSIDALKEELYEMEGAFCLLLFSSFIGLPAPPAFLGIALLPYMERELIIMITKSHSLEDRFSKWFDIADI